MATRDVSDGRRPRPAPLLAELLPVIGEAVESVVAQGVDPNDPYRGLYITDHAAQGIATSLETASVRLSDECLSAAADALQLDPVATSVLAFLAAPEIDPRFGRIFAYLQDDITRQWPTPRLVGAVLSRNGMSRRQVLGAFSARQRLRSVGAIREIPPRHGVAPVADRMFRLADRLACRVVGASLDVSDPPGTRLVDWDKLQRLPLGREQAVREVAGRLQAGSRQPLLIAGPDADLVLAAALQRSVVVMNASAFDSELLPELRLLSALDGRGVCFEGFEELEPKPRGRVVQAILSGLDQPVFLAPLAARAHALGTTSHALVEVGLPSIAERRALWQAVGPQAGTDDVAAKFRLSADQIVEAAATAEVHAELRGDRPGAEDLDHGARVASTTGLIELSQRVDASFDWSDLILSERAERELRSVSAYVRQRDRVLSDWGFARRARAQGIKVLFAGDSGTGKTMSAQVLAHDLGLSIYQINIAAMVSKYIGETEKNLDRIFTAAEGSNAILFFDEADALFGKRSEVSDAHDRYANIEVAYLLQKMERYEGAVILATNYRNNIDDAFLRRLDFVIDFPFPEAADRERIWRVSLPEEAPLESYIDFQHLASFKLSGGNIRNATLAAAFIAAEENAAIGMPHLLRAVAQEYAKLGRLTVGLGLERYVSADQLSA